MLNAILRCYFILQETLNKSIIFLFVLSPTLFEPENLKLSGIYQKRKIPCYQL